MVCFQWLNRQMTRDHPRTPKTSSDRPSHHERRHAPGPDEQRSVRLIRKYADMIDGVDLGDSEVGDRLSLPSRDADVLIAEGWAVPDERRVRLLPRRAIAADHSNRPRKKPGN